MRLLAVQRLHAFDAADNQPYHPEQQDQPADHNDRQERANQDVQRTDPESADLELVMALEPVRCAVLVACCC